MLDPQYLDAIKGFEGFVPEAQWDYKQHSNGYGTRAQYPGEVIDLETADKRFQDEVAKAQAHVESVAPDAPPGVKAALTSLTYNAGPKWSSSGLGDLVRAGDWTAAAERFQQYNKAGGQVNPGLVARRTKEAEWFKNDAPQLPPSVNVAQAPQVAGAPPLDLASFRTPPAPLDLASFRQQPIFPAASQPQPQQPGGGGSLFAQMPAEQAAPPPIFSPHRKPIDISRLKAALASGNRGLFFSKG